MPPQRRLRIALQETIAAEEAAQEEIRGLRERNGWLTHKLDQVEVHLKAMRAGKFDAMDGTVFLLRQFFPENAGVLAQPGQDSTNTKNGL